MLPLIAPGGLVLAAALYAASAPSPDGAGYVLGKVTDLFLDLSHYRADNYTDNPTVTLPLNMGQTLQSGFLTCVRRQNERLTYTMKYGYATNGDGTYGGQNDFSAHMFYGKVQYKF